uniref:Uncharacterized protein n=1 Tax=Oryza barthii TaxID=65489 RepID=A0A0D3ESY4_9ORYZ
MVLTITSRYTVTSQIPLIVDALFAKYTELVTASMEREEVKSVQIWVVHSSSPGCDTNHKAVMTVHSDLYQFIV